MYVHMAIILFINVSFYSKIVEFKQELRSVCNIKQFVS